MNEMPIHIPKYKKKSKKSPKKLSPRKKIRRGNFILDQTEDFVNFLKELNKITDGNLFFLMKSLGAVYFVKFIDYLISKYNYTRKIKNLKKRMSNDMIEYKQLDGKSIKTMNIIARLEILSKRMIVDNISYRELEHDDFIKDETFYKTIKVDDNHEIRDKIMKTIYSITGSNSVTGTIGTLNSIESLNEQLKKNNLRSVSPIYRKLSSPFISFLNSESETESESGIHNPTPTPHHSPVSSPPASPPGGPVVSDSSFSRKIFESFNLSKNLSKKKNDFGKQRRSRRRSLKKTKRSPRRSRRKSRRS
jgi:hypothetical protein